MYLSDIYTISANLAGIPGLSIPCGKDKMGLPIECSFLAAVSRKKHCFAQVLRMKRQERRKRDGTV